MGTVCDGIVVGAFGGACAGIMISVMRGGYVKWRERSEKKRVYAWLQENTSDQDGNRYRSTRAIASWNNLTQDRVRYICSIHDKIYLSTGQGEDMWSIYDRGGRSVDN